VLELTFTFTLVLRMTCSRIVNYSLVYKIKAMYDIGIFTVLIYL